LLQRRRQWLIIAIGAALVGLLVIIVDAVMS